MNFLLKGSESSSSSTSNLRIWFVTNYWDKILLFSYIITNVIAWIRWIYSLTHKKSLLNLFRNRVIVESTDQTKFHLNFTWTTVTYSLDIRRGWKVGTGPPSLSIRISSRDSREQFFIMECRILMHTVSVTGKKLPLWPFFRIQGIVYKYQSPNELT